MPSGRRGRRRRGSPRCRCRRRGRGRDVARLAKAVNAERDDRIAGDRAEPEQGRGVELANGDKCSDGPQPRQQPLGHDRLAAGARRQPIAVRAVERGDRQEPGFSGGLWLSPRVLREPRGRRHRNRRSRARHRAPARAAKRRRRRSPRRGPGRSFAAAGRSAGSTAGNGPIGPPRWIFSKAQRNSTAARRHRRARS